MLSSCLVYLRLGFEHIADWQAYDHLLFVAALCVSYPLRAWRPLLVLVTAFTIGHSVTLVLATLNLVRIDPVLVETLIPVTIVLTSLVNVVESSRLSEILAEPARARRIKYGTALFFGLIHGMGFSSFLRAALGAEERITLPLFAFNVGLEVGQVVIVAGLLLLGAAVVRFRLLDRRGWVLVVSGAAGGIALTMILDRIAA
jgi:hypothetical protein